MLRTCCAGLAEANGAEMAHHSASAEDGMDTEAGSWAGWKQPGTLGTSWAPGDDDGIQWEDTDGAEDTEPGIPPLLHCHV